MKKIAFIIILLSITTFSVIAHDGNRHRPLLPKPQKIEYNKGYSKIANSIKITGYTLNAEFSQFIKENNILISDKSNSIIDISITDSIEGVRANKEEAYSIEISNNKISIKAYTDRGIYWAVQTLRQLQIKKGKEYYFPNCNITDYPAFKIRGFMHDVGRSFISINELKKQIDLLSKFKINVFHWHLTENQAWRIESKIYPQINDSVNMTRFKGKYYTQEEAKDLVNYCKTKNMLLIPEIDMPGHSAAFERTFNCDMQSDKGTEILKVLVNEICDVFDVPYLHIGTDEVKFYNNNFVSEMVSLIRSKGKKVISWNPGWNYKIGEIDMTQLWSYRGKAQEGIPAIDSRFHYINHFDAFADIVALYRSRIYNTDMGNDNIAGAIIGIWNDRILADEKDIIRENHFYPNMLAIAERAWCGGGDEYFNKRGTNLSRSDDPIFFKEFQYFEGRMLHYKNTTFKNEPFTYMKQTNVKWHITDAFPNNADLEKVFPPEIKISDYYTYENKRYEVKEAYGAGIYLRHVWGSTIPAFYNSPKENHTAYAYTYVYSPKKQEVGLFAEFQNYSRSESDIPPTKGKWDYKGSRIWINDKEIEAPEWENTHTKRDNEIPLRNENYVSRPPIKVILDKGWNKVFIKLPVGKFNLPQTRLVKWHFTTIFVTLDGKKTIDNIVYSPNKNLKEK